jgi:hypothetical protein
MHDPTRQGNSFPFRILFPAGIALAIALRLLLVAATPFGQTIRFHLEGLNDEPAHVNYVKYLAVNHALPVQRGTVKDSGAFIRNDFEYYQPPLYYAIGALFYAALGARKGFVACRLFSFLCGILTVFLAGAIVGKTVRNGVLRRYAVLFAALFPTHAYFCALVSNDALSWLFAALMVYELIGAGSWGAVAHPGWGRAARLTLWLAAGMLTKSSLVIFFFVMAACGVAAALKMRKPAALLPVCGIIGVAAVIAAPWYVRNLSVYHSLFALNMGFGPPARIPATLPAIGGLIAMTIRYFWFPMQHGLPHSTGIKLCNIFGALVVAAQAVAAARYLGDKKRRTFEVAVLALLLALAVASYISLNVSHAEPEGRFLLPAFSAIVFFFGAPVVALFSRIGREPWALWIGAATALAPWCYLVFTKSA